MATGLRRQRVWLVVAICALSDVALIAVGVGGLGGLLARAPRIIVAARILGALYLTYFAITKFRSARRTEALASSEATTTHLASSTLALTWLNPHVYLDTVVLLGSVSARYGLDRWSFAAGAGSASVLWFSALGFGAAALAPLVKRPSFWRILDVVVGVIVVAVAVSLAVGA
jgi:L-lysine exporter family protein LysE/ArgO